ncbi:MAG: hypothetical protein HYS13_14275 [Planctomycetia bacterium]|nr:hypothetical protein [Planctomycetia bacterium]
MDFVCSSLCFLVIPTAACLVIARFVLRPIHDAARPPVPYLRGESPTLSAATPRLQFEVAEVLILVFYVSLGLAAGHAGMTVLPREIRADLETWHQVLLHGLSALLLAALWWTGIRLLHKAQVRRRSMRLLLLLMLPVVYAGSFLFLPMVISIAVVGINRRGTQFLGFAVALAAVVAGLLAAHRLAGAVAAASEAPWNRGQDSWEPADRNRPPEPPLPPPGAPTL